MRFKIFRASIALILYRVPRLLLLCLRIVHPLLIISICNPTLVHCLLSQRRLVLPACGLGLNCESIVSLARIYSLGIFVEDHEFFDADLSLLGEMSGKLRLRIEFARMVG